MHSLNYLLYTCSPLRKHLSSWGRDLSVQKKDASLRTNQNYIPVWVFLYIKKSFPSILLTWPLIRHSGCGRNSCTATGRSSPGRQAHLWPRRAPGAGRGTFWPTFTHTRLAYVRPVCARWSQTDLPFSLIYRNIIRMALSHRFAVP